MDKSTLRPQMLEKRQKLSMEQHRQLDQKIFDQAVFALSGCKSIGIYCAFKGEVDTYGIMEHFFWDREVSLACPRVKGKTMDFVWIESFEDLVMSKQGILEPTGQHIAQDLDALIIPLLAFDQRKYRLGYGGGYYDRYLVDYPGKTIGLAYDFQEVDDLEVAAHDIPLQMIITNQFIL